MVTRVIQEYCTCPIGVRKANEAGDRSKKIAKAVATLERAIRGQENAIKEAEEMMSDMSLDFYAPEIGRLQAECNMRRKTIVRYTKLLADARNGKFSDDEKPNASEGGASTAARGTGYAPPRKKTILVLIKNDQQLEVQFWAESEGQYTYKLIDGTSGSVAKADVKTIMTVSDDKQP